MVIQERLKCPIIAKRLIVAYLSNKNRKQDCNTLFLINIQNQDFNGNLLHLAC